MALLQRAESQVRNRFVPIDWHSFDALPHASGPAGGLASGLGFDGLAPGVRRCWGSRSSTVPPSSGRGVGEEGAGLGQILDEVKKGSPPDEVGRARGDGRG